jgi:hypothetical protein
MQHCTAPVATCLPNLGQTNPGARTAASLVSKREADTITVLSVCTRVAEHASSQQPSILLLVAPHAQFYARAAVGPPVLQVAACTAHRAALVIHSSTTVLSRRASRIDRRINPAGLTGLLGLSKPCMMHQYCTLTTQQTARSVQHQPGVPRVLRPAGACAAAGASSTHKATNLHQYMNKLAPPPNQIKLG